MANIYGTQTTMQIIMDKSSVTSAFKNISDGLVKSLGAAREGFEKGKAGLPRGIYGPQGAAASMGSVAGKISSGVKGLEEKGAEITGGKGMEALKTGAVMGTVVSLMRDGNDMLGSLMKMFRTMFQLLILPLIMVLMPVIVPVLRSMADNIKKFTEAMKTGDVPEMVVTFLPLATMGILAILAAGVASVAINLTVGAIAAALQGVLSGALSAVVSLTTSFAGILYAGASSLGAFLAANAGFIFPILGAALVGLAVGIVIADVALKKDAARKKGQEFIWDSMEGKHGVIYATLEVSQPTKPMTALEGAGKQWSMLIGDPLTYLQSAMATLSSGVPILGENFWSKLTETFDRATLAEELGNSIAEPVAYGMESMLGVGSNTRKGPLSNVVSWMPNFFITLIAGMQAWAPKFESTLTEIFTKAMQGAINITSSAVSRIMDMIASASKALSSLNSSKISTSNINAPNIPRMAEGGIVTSPTLAMIGESGPEAVVPLGKGMGGEKIIITNYITVSPGADKGEMEKLFTKFAREQGKELRRRTSYIGGIYA